MYIFTDSSVDPISRKGIGCYIIMNDLNEPFIKQNIVSLEFDDTSSTVAELKTIKHILNQLDLKYDNLANNLSINLYTDCENFVNLINKRQYDQKIIKHRNYIWYEEIIKLVNELKINIIWVKGHAKMENRNEIYQKHFAIIDKQSRKLLRNYVALVTNHDESRIIYP